MRLSELKTGQEAIIIKILGHGAFRKRVMEMGFTKGHEIVCLMSAPLKDPIKYRILDYEISLRRSEADMIEVVPVEDYLAPESASASDRLSQGEDDYDPKARRDHSHTINVALIGNPNCGKTSLFNIASGASEHVGNYSGVTVDSKTGHLRHKGYRINIVDLPGTYSLSAYSPEELYVRRYLRDRTPDVIINVVDASNLERNLYLTTELIDMDRPMVIALNIYDELLKAGHSLDYSMLGKMIGVPIIPTVTRTGEGTSQLFDAVIDIYEDRHRDVRHVHVKLGEEIESSVNAIKAPIKADRSASHQFSPRYLAIKLLEGDKEAEDLISRMNKSEEIIKVRDAERLRLQSRLDDDITSMIANEKYGFISGALAETMTRNQTDSVTSTHIIDSVVTSRVLGFPIFAIIMFLTFWFTFYVGQYPQGWIESGCEALSSLVNNLLPPGILKDLIADGIIGGVGGVIVFLPNILILYFFISLMEDSGYMARAAFIMDKMMHKIGLHGKSFIPLVMGFGCNVPAIMASRSIESRSSKLITIMINPFISCSARIPIYVLLIGTFFDSHAALVFCAIYLLGVIVGMATAKMLRKLVFKADETPFVMELPPYRIPTFKTIVRHMWSKAHQYIKKMGGIILVASIIVWALNYFPRHDNDSLGNTPVESAVTTDASASAIASSDINDDASPRSDRIDPSRDSYLEMAGKAVNPLLRPLGFNWQATVAAIAGIPAKEIVVSTLGVLYTGNESTDEASLSAKISAPASEGSTPFTLPSALSFMVFILLYCPCIATLTAIYNETGSLRYPLFSVVYNTAVAWLLAFVVYRIALML